MRSYLVSYVLNNSGKKYEDLLSAIQRFPQSWRHHEALWLVKTDWTARQVRDYLKPWLDSSDQLLVVELTGEGSWSGLNDEAITWLSEYL